MLSLQLHITLLTIKPELCTAEPDENEKKVVLYKFESEMLKAEKTVEEIGMVSLETVKKELGDV